MFGAAGKRVKGLSRRVPRRALPQNPGVAAVMPAGDSFGEIQMPFDAP